MADRTNQSGQVRPERVARRGRARGQVAVDRLADLPAAIAAAVQHESIVDRATIERYFQAVWDRSWPGDLYDLDQGNVAAFAGGLESYLKAGQDHARHP